MSCQLDANFALGVFLFVCFNQIRRKYPEQAVAKPKVISQIQGDCRSQGPVEEVNWATADVCMGSQSLPCGPSESLHTEMHLKKILAPVHSLLLKNRKL